MALRWDKDHQRVLRNRARAVEVTDGQLTASMLGYDKARVSKAEMRAAGENAVRNYATDPKGEWVIACQCGQKWIERIPFAVALEQEIICAECHQGRWLTDEHLKPPWE
jgi:hypothetical protein